jgi:methionyl-tRNA synthetase
MNINIDDFKKMEIKIGTVLSVEKVPDADRLIKFSIDLGESAPRTILSGIAMHYSDPTVLVGKQVPVLANLETRIIRGIESQGMILYVVGEDMLTTLEPGVKVIPGTKVA